jgi:hypothetical protein
VGSSPNLDLLRRIARSVCCEPLKQGPFSEADLHSLGLFKGMIGPKGIYGIRVEAAREMGQLADEMYNRSQFARASTFDIFANQLSTTIIQTFAGRTTPVTAADVVSIEKQMTEWLRGQIASREFYIPCFLSPWDAASFSIGPVAFMHIGAFAQQAQRESEGVLAVTFSPMLEQAARSAANWVATVKVDGRAEDRAQEVANLAVDIALGGVQLCIPEDGAQFMARMTGRSMPVFGQAISRADGHLKMAVTNTEPGRAFGPRFLDQRLTASRPMLDAIGRRVALFIDGGGVVPALEQAWCDAAYWFHEGLAEPLDTIAVPKLETAIEVLLHSESSKGSKRRVLQAIGAFYGLREADQINPDSQTTVGQFAQGLVRDRSRILHGTWSTLTHSFHASRPSLTTLVRGLLAMYALELDQYLVNQSPADDVEAFLAFVSARRNATQAVAPNTVDRS